MILSGWKRAGQPPEQRQQPSDCRGSTICRWGNRISMTSTNSLEIPVLESLVTKHKRALNLAILHVFDLSSINVAISLTHSPHIFVTFLIPCWLPWVPGPRVSWISLQPDVTSSSVLVIGHSGHIGKRLLSLSRMPCNEGKNQVLERWITLYLMCIISRYFYSHFSQKKKFLDRTLCFRWLCIVIQIFSVCTGRWNIIS